MEQLGEATRAKHSGATDLLSYGVRRISLDMIGDGLDLLWRALELIRKAMTSNGVALPSRDMRCKGTTVLGMALA